MRRLKLSLLAEPEHLGTAPLQAGRTGRIIASGELCGSGTPQ
jgi:hypothetical protein